MDTNTEKQEYTITVYTENQVGLLNRIAIIFSRRKINVESLDKLNEISKLDKYLIQKAPPDKIPMKISGLNPSFLIFLYNQQKKYYSILL